MNDIFQYERGGLDSLEIGTRYRLTEELCKMTCNNAKYEIIL